MMETAANRRWFESQEKDELHKIQCLDGYDETIKLYISFIEKAKI